MTGKTRRGLFFFRISNPRFTWEPLIARRDGRVVGPSRTKGRTHVQILPPKPDAFSYLGRCILFSMAFFQRTLHD
jgi:hypothetical protein